MPQQNLAPMYEAFTPRYQSSGETVKDGRVKGVVTYYFNQNFGDKADVGSNVLLISGTVEVPADCLAIIQKDTISIISDKQCTYSGSSDIAILDQTVVDANGSFELDDITPGTYTVIIRSKHSVGDIRFVPRDGIGRWEIISIEVKADRATDASHGFPATSL